jgi:hypothetical protein
MLQHWDQQLQLLNRKILLLVDNYRAYPKLDSFQNIKLVFVSVNAMNILQPMDQEVITSLKHHFHKSILLRMIKCADKKSMQ